MLTFQELVLTEIRERWGLEVFYVWVKFVTPDGYKTVYFIDSEAKFQHMLHIYHMFNSAAITSSLIQMKGQWVFPWAFCSGWKYCVFPFLHSIEFYATGFCVLSNRKCFLPVLRCIHQPASVSLNFCDISCIPSFCLHYKKPWASETEFFKRNFSVGESQYYWHILWHNSNGNDLTHHNALVTKCYIIIEGIFHWW